MYSKELFGQGVNSKIEIKEFEGGYRIGATSKGNTFPQVQHFFEIFLKTTYF